MKNNKWKSVKMEWIKNLIFTSEYDLEEFESENFTYELTSQLIEIEILKIEK